MGFAQSIFDILNKDSGAVLALSSVTATVATVTLIFWTIKYVRLTRSLVASSSEQFRHTIKERNEKLEANKQGLHELTKIFLIILSKLPSARQKAADMVGVILWTEEDLVDMRHLARGLDGKTIGNVFWAIYHLNKIHARVRKVQADVLQQEKELAEFPWEEYSGTLQQAKRELSHLLELL